MLCLVISAVVLATTSRDVRNGFFKFGSVLRKTTGSVSVQF